LTAVVLAAGCNRVPDLANTYPSADEVARAVLGALERRDRAALEALSLNETEFRDHVWPGLPAARPERNLPFSYVWGDLRQKSNAGLSRTLSEHGGRRYELTRVTFAGQTAFGAYTVHRQATLHVTDASAATLDLRVLGSMIAMDAEWKVFSYVVDDD
jgi:hypothetical protein